MNAVTKLDDPGQYHMPADPMVSMIERVVMSPDADLDKLERMLAMKERMDAQSARIAFARALSTARAEMPPVMKDATVDFTHNGKRTHYRHETLAGIAKQIDPILSKHGLSYRFRTEQGQGGVKVTCIIQHAQGHSEENSLAGAPDQSGNKNGFQAVGSAVTYLQRYTLKAALGLSAEVDDDGQAAAPRPDTHHDAAPDRRRDHSPPPRQQERPQRHAAPAHRPDTTPPDAPPARDPVKIADGLKRQIAKAPSVEHLTAMNQEGQKFGDAWQWLEDEGHVDLCLDVKAAFDARKAALAAPVNADLGGDEVPF